MDIRLHHFSLVGDLGARTMKNFSLLRAILSSVIGLVIGVIFTALVKLIMPATNLAWTLIPICLAAIFSGFAGYLVGAKLKK
jgi:ABC-type bacteriocin/lantibiotic exporter with double-glycine peptidase domain